MAASSSPRASATPRSCTACARRWACASSSPSTPSRSPPAWRIPTTPTCCCSARTAVATRTCRSGCATCAAGSDRLLTDGKSLHGAPVFAHDGKRIAFYGNARDGASYDIYVTRHRPAAARRSWWSPAAAMRSYVQDWSLDDRRSRCIRYTLHHRQRAAAGGRGHRRAARASSPRAAGTRRGNRCRGRRRRGSRAMAAACFSSPIAAASSSALHYVDLYTAIEVRTLTPDTRWDVERFDAEPGRPLHRLHAQRRRHRPAGAARPGAAGRHAAAAAARRRA